MAKNSNKNGKKTGGPDGSTGGESSLRTLVADLRKQTMVGNDDQIATNFILTNISHNIADLTSHMLKMPVIMSTGGSSAGALETAAEQKQEQAKDNKREETIKDVLQNSLTELKALRKDMKSGGIMDILVIGASLLSGFVVGLVQKIVSFFKPVLSLFKFNMKLIDTVVDLFKTGWSKFIGIFKSIASIFTENAVFQKIVNVFKSGWTYFANIFKEIGSVINTISDMLGVVFGKGKETLGFFAKFAKYFDDIGSMFKIFFKVGQMLGSVIGKLMIPIQVIMSLFDFVNGALDGWNKTQGSTTEKFMAAVQGGITGLVNGLIGGLLNLMKDGVSWILNLLGFENTSKMLDSFSFETLITDAIDGFFKFVKDMVDFVKNIFTNPGAAMEQLTNLGDMMQGFIKSVLRSVLPKPGSDGPAGWAAKAIPDAVYEYAGLNPKTGDVVQSTSSTGVGAKALDKTASENAAVKDDGAAKVAAASAAASMNSSSSSNVTNNTTQAAIIKSKTTNWEPDDQYARGGMAWGA